MQQRKSEKAFTLVELLLVVTIIGILAGAVLVNFSGQSQRAMETRAKMDIANLETALSTYEITNGKYPSSDVGLESLIQEGEDGSPPILRKKSFKDPWGNDYRYEYPGNKGVAEYDLYSIGADEQEGTDDDIGNWSDE